MNVFNWNLGLFNPGGRREIRGYHHVCHVSRSVYVCLDCRWGAGIGRIDAKKTRRRRRVSSSFSGRFRTYTVKLLVGEGSGWPGGSICTSWAPLAAGIATSGEARGGGCKIAVWPLDFWRWWSGDTALSDFSIQSLMFQKLRFKP